VVGLRLLSLVAAWSRMPSLAEDCCAIPVMHDQGTTCVLVSFSAFLAEMPLQTFQPLALLVSCAGAVGLHWSLRFWDGYGLVTREAGRS
jgi:hypothetical protein